MFKVANYAHQCLKGIKESFLSNPVKSSALPPSLEQASTCGQELHAGWKTLAWKNYSELRLGRKVTVSFDCHCQRARQLCFLDSQNALMNSMLSSGYINTDEHTLYLACSICTRCKLPFWNFCLDSWPPTMFLFKRLLLEEEKRLRICQRPLGSMLGSNLDPLDFPHVALRTEKPVQFQEQRLQPAHLTCGRGIRVQRLDHSRSSALDAMYNRTFTGKSFTESPGLCPGGLAGPRDCSNVSLALLSLTLPPH